jgi:hypothetical protein
MMGTSHVAPAVVKATARGIFRGSIVAASLVGAHAAAAQQFAEPAVVEECTSPDDDSDDIEQGKIEKYADHTAAFLLRTVIGSNMSGWSKSNAFTWDGGYPSGIGGNFTVTVEGEGYEVAGVSSFGIGRHYHRHFRCVPVAANPRSPAAPHAGKMKGKVK